MGNAKYKQKHKEQGLCRDCSRPAFPGRNHCISCSQANKESTRKSLKKPGNYERHLKQSQKLRKKYRETNRCVICSAPLGEQDAGYVCCVNCRSRAMRGIRSLPPISGEQLENYYKSIAKQS